MQKQIGVTITTLHLKIFAAIYMMIDHIAYLLIPNGDIYWAMRVIGRLSAPLFWYCFVEGYRHTSNTGKYKIRLAVWALVMGVGNLLISVLPNAGYLPALSFADPNMFVTFFLMAVAIDAANGVVENTDLSLRLLWLLVLIIILGIVVLCAEYGFFVAFSILCLYFIRNRTIKYTLFAVGNIFICLATRNLVQMFAVFAIIPMISCSDQKPQRSLKWFFYLFYPLHFWVLCIIKLVMQYLQ